MHPVRTPVPGTAEHHVWLSAFLYGSLEGQQELLADHVAPWVAGLAGDDTLRWFYVRYVDAASGRPHLRLRVRAPREHWGNTVVPAFRGRARGLLATGVVNDVAVHPYRPEVERYGGAHLMEAAERVFHLDSMFALERLDQDSPAHVAPDVVTLIRAFHGGRAGEGDDWLLRAVPKNEELHRAYTRQRRHMQRAVGPQTGPPSSELEANGGRPWPTTGHRRGGAPPTGPGRTAERRRPALDGPHVRPARRGPHTLQPTAAPDRRTPGGSRGVRPRPGRRAGRPGPRRGTATSAGPSPPCRPPLPLSTAAAPWTRRGTDA
ncbi:thiopeptide-type bacteriocin biosynthesis protein [Streptomyces sp. NPDC086010]|uniref:thiopeptide-type bacteriocin biosynthesis protein n=1 Tax=Streptomyces sp. NPDC086010 TaxID=3365745 RepID=UPI0037D84FCB